MVKSEEELKLHREAAYLHEMSYNLAKKAIRPGRTVAEVMAEIRHAQLLAGSEEQQFGISFGRQVPDTIHRAAGVILLYGELSRRATSSIC